MNVAQFHIFLSAQANFPLISAMYLQKAKALQDEETGKRRLQINLGGTFLATRRKKRWPKQLGHTISTYLDRFGGTKKMDLNSLSLSGVFMLGILVYHTLNYYHMLQWDSERNHGSNVELTNQ